MKRFRRLALAVLATVAAGVYLQEASIVSAIPPFARKYQTSCTTCHSAMPRLNATGEAFRLNGYKFLDDEMLVKEEPVELGDEAYKNIWPKAIWPADIPKQTPLALRTQLVGHVLLNSDEEVRQDFRMPNNLWILAGGTIGEKFSYFLHTHAFSEGEGEFTVARVFLQYNDALDGLLGENSLNIKMGLFEPAAVPFSSFTNLTLTNYALNSYSFTLGDGWGGAGHHGGALALGRSQRGIEFNGLVGDRLFYGLGVVNGNGAAVSEESYDNNNAKDFYFRLSYKLGGLAPSGRTPEDAASSASWPERSVKIGVFGYWGDNTQEDLDLATVDDADVEDYQQVGFDVTARWDGWEILSGMVLSSVDLHRQVVRASYTQDYSVQMTEVSYQVYPWLHPYVRYEFVDREDQEDLQRWIVGASGMIRTNVKLSIEGIIDKELDDAVLVAVDWAF